MSYIKSSSSVLHLNLEKRILIIIIIVVVVTTTTSTSTIFIKVIVIILMMNSTIISSIVSIIHVNQLFLVGLLLLKLLHGPMN
jgi:hypothetical protein